MISVIIHVSLSILKYIAGLLTIVSWIFIKMCFSITNEPNFDDFRFFDCVGENLKTRRNPTIIAIRSYKNYYIN